jgi:hypothetical protein
MQRNLSFAIFMVLCLALSPALAAPIFVGGPSPVAPFSGTVIDFEGLVEGAAVPALGGVSFSQPDGGTPIADNSPFLFAYDSSSGSGVLTGGPPSTVTTAGIIASFGSGQSRVGAFMSDTAPLGAYRVSAFGLGGVFLESQVVAAASFPTIPGFPSPDARCDATTPFTTSGAACGVFVGFSRPSADIYSIQFGPSSSAGDAFAIDDLTFAAPEPATLALMALGLMGVGITRRHRS